jgi:tetratricopeptide (TPR) repeat protein
MRWGSPEDAEITLTGVRRRRNGICLALGVGQLDLAINEQKRLLRKKPENEDTANRLAELYARADQNADAVEFFSSVAEALFTRGRLGLAASYYQRVLRIDPGDSQALIRCGEIAAADRRFSDAHGYFAAAADQCLVEGDADGASAIRARIDTLDLTEIQQRLTVARLRTNSGGVLDLLNTSLRAAAQTSYAPDIRFNAQLARTFVQRGDAAAAAECLSSEMAGSDPQLLLTVAEIQLRGGKLDEGVASAERVAADGSLLDQVARLGADVAAHAPGIGFRLVEVAVNRWCEKSKWPEAKAALEQFMSVVPDYAAAKTRLTHVTAMASMTARLSAIASKARSTILSFDRSPSTTQSPAEPA